MAKLTVEEVMRSIVAMAAPDVFEVKLWLRDYDSTWHASAELRSGHAEHKSYHVADIQALHALLDLKCMLERSICPHCGRHIDERGGSSCETNP